MNLFIYINSGERKGSKITLEEFSKSEKLDFILEDEDITFEYVLSNDFIEQGYQNVKLHLHEIGFDASEIQITPDGKRFLWFNERNRSRNELFFRNYCGIAELSLNLTGYGLDNYILFNHVDILASKISADRITAMLEYLSQNDAKDIAALARITKREAGLKQDKELITSLVDKLSSYLVLIKEIFPNIIYKPITKVQPVSKIISFSDNLHLNYESIKWLSNNLDELNECSKYDDFDLVLNGKYYKINKILVNFFVENTDIYENQIIHGFISLLIRKIDSIIFEYNSKYVDSSRGYSFGSYFSLFSKISKFQYEITKGLIQKCERFRSELMEVNKILSEKLPVSREILNNPIFTLKVKNNNNYKIIFQKMIEIKNLGSPDWSLQDELNSIRDIPKLFEYYCLLITKRSIDKALNNLASISPKLIFNNNGSDTCFSYSTEDLSVDIFYEPKIWGDKNKESTIPSLINPEAWVTSKNYIKVRNNTYKGLKSRYRSPDIVIRLKKQDTEDFIIIDAKYTNNFLSWNTYLPELVMKYIHGINNKSGSNSTLALIVLSPDEKSFTRHYLEHDYTIYGDNTVYPSLFNSILDINNSNDIENNYAKDINQILTNYFVDEVKSPSHI